MEKLMNDKPVVFYDGACPLCSREIAHYKKRQGSVNLRWLDISRQDIDLEQYGLDYNRAMKEFHVLSPDGKFHTGASGFVYLWSFLRPYRLLSRIILRLGLIEVLNWCYGKFATRRIRRKCNETCNN
jgi:predicted DCC family thiol-disulfide oxidoreductase YuxK